MREILFRGKTLTSGEWVYGFYVGPNNARHHEIFSPDDGALWAIYIIDPSTLGQYTDLTDKNGVKIFEGDIVHVHDTLLQCTKPYHEFNGYVDFADGSYRVVGDDVPHYRWIDYDVEVIGNIHDSKELLEETT